MSKRKNREAREREAEYQLSRDPHFIAGATLAAQSQRGCRTASADTLLEGRARSSRARFMGGAVTRSGNRPTINRTTTHDRT